MYMQLVAHANWLEVKQYSTTNQIYSKNWSLRNYNNSKTYTCTCTHTCTYTCTRTCMLGSRLTGQRNN